jgi:hypothetical protein
MTTARLVLFMLASILALGGAGCETRPDFNIDQAQMDIAHAFQKVPRQVAVYSDARGTERDTWIVDFHIDGVAPGMQARFKGTKSWNLQDVRVAPAGTEETPWESVGVLLGRQRGEARERALDTMHRMSQLADYIGQYSVRNGNKFPAVTLSALKEMLIADGSVQAKDWKHDTDAWGQALVYHAAPDGVSYILVSEGADGQLDHSQEEYFANTDRGMEAYGGKSANPDADIIIASGGFVQAYED